MGDIQKITEEINKFVDERDWRQFHNPKDMALSILLEAAELVEHFQWLKGDEIEERSVARKSEIQEEIADVAVLLFEMAHNLQIDLGEAIRLKMIKNRQKYPIEKAKGKHTKYDKL